MWGTPRPAELLPHPNIQLHDARRALLGHHQGGQVRLGLHTAVSLLPREGGAARRNTDRVERGSVIIYSLFEGRRDDGECSASPLVPWCLAAPHADVDGLRATENARPPAVRFLVVGQMQERRLRVAPRSPRAIFCRLVAAGGHTRSVCRYASRTGCPPRSASQCP